MKTKEADRKFLVRELPLENLEVARSEGNCLIDSRGKRYIDFFMGWCVGNAGWGNKEIEKRIRQYQGPDYVFPAYLYKGWAELAALLASIAPGRLRKSFRATGGTEAIEIALQAAMSHTKRQKFISIEGSYHGHSIGALSIGSSDFRSWYKNLLPDCFKIKPPLADQAADQLEALLKGRDIAAFILEPIGCNLGVEIPTRGFMSRAQALCRQYGTLLVMDEVATGFGRTGKLFASEHFGIEPDILCLAKGITGGYGGLGAAMATEEVARSMGFEFSFYSTYGWHPRSVEAALANIRYLVRHRKQLEKNVGEMGAYFVERLSRMKFESAPNIRAKGLAIGVTLERPGYAKEVVARARKRGVLLCPEPDNRTFTLFPALNIDRKTAAEGLDRMEAAL